MGFIFIALETQGQSVNLTINMERDGKLISHTQATRPVLCCPHEFTALEYEVKENWRGRHSSKNSVSDQK